MEQKIEDRKSIWMKILKVNDSTCMKNKGNMGIDV